MTDEQRADWMRDILAQVDPAACARYEAGEPMLFHEEDGTRVHIYIDGRKLPMQAGS